jgi:hypothetical protein
MIGVGVSLYDKFDDLSVLVDILNEYFDEEYYIAACSEHEDADERLAEIDIDEAVPPSNIHYTPLMENPTARINRVSRILESVRRTCRACEQAGCSHVVHLHADAWPLSEDRLTALRDGIDEREATIAIRGAGPSYRTPGSRGHFMDQFFTYEVERAQSINLMDWQPLDLLPAGSVHSAMALLVCGRVGRSNVWHYDDMQSDIYWDGAPRSHPVHVRPSVYVPNWQFVHVAADDFPENYGRNVQAMYLDRHGIDVGRHVTQFLNEWLIDEGQLLGELESIDSQLDRRLRRYWYDVSQFNRYFDTREEVLSNSRATLAFAALRNVVRGVYLRANQLMLRLPYSAYLLDPERRPFDLEQSHADRTLDSEWPVSTDELYTENVDCNDFPNDLCPDWVKSKSAREDQPSRSDPDV